MGYRNTYFNDSENQSNKDWYTCVRCQKKLRKGDAEIDHILPQSVGGDDSVENLQCMCKRCNCSKGNGIDGTESDYKDNQLRRTPPTKSDVKDLNDALNQGAKALSKWFKK